jgi:hypothetical protein
MMTAWSVAGMVLAAGLVAPIATLVAAQPQAGAPLLVIIPPWRDADGVLADARMRPASPVRAPFAVLATPLAPDVAPPGSPADPDDGRALKRSALRASGAWAVLGAGSLSFLCSEPT